MAAPDISDLINAAKEIVRKAKTEGVLSSLTVRIIRERVETHFSLNAGTLEAKEYKKRLKVAIMEAKDESKPETTHEEVTRQAPLERHTLPERVKDTQEPVSKPTIGKRRRDGVKEFKSAAMILSSDGEDGGEAETSLTALRHSVKGEDSIQLNAPPSKRPKTQHAGGNRNDIVKKHTVKKASELTIDEEEAQNSDSGMSSLFREPSKQKQKTKASDKDTRKTRAKDNSGAKSKSSGEAVSKDEATIKRLKSFVTACGVRKVWVKVFEGCEKPSQQIKKLKEILAELGMTGRLSLEQAKKIREKRELAKELEDVKSFEEAVVGRGSRNRVPSSSKSQLQDRNSEEDEDEEYVKPTKRKSTALRSITAFLEDQSDEE